MTPSPGCGTLGKSVALFGLQEAQEAGVHLQGPICRSGLVMGASHVANGLAPHGPQKPGQCELGKRVCVERTFRDWPGDLAGMWKTGQAG